MLSGRPRWRVVVGAHSRFVDDHNGDRYGGMPSKHRAYLEALSDVSVSAVIFLLGTNEGMVLRPVELAFAPYFASIDGCRSAIFTPAARTNCVTRLIGIAPMPRRRRPSRSGPPHSLTHPREAPQVAGRQPDVSLNPETPSGHDRTHGWMMPGQRASDTDGCPMAHQRATGQYLYRRAWPSEARCRERGAARDRRPRPVRRVGLRRGGVDQTHRHT